MLRYSFVNRLPVLVCWRQGDPFWLRLVSDPRLLDIAEQYVGSDIALFQSHYICKEPRDGQVVLWHQVSVHTSAHLHLHSIATDSCC